MAISPKVKQYLDKEKVDYQLLEHSQEFSAMKIAAAQHMPGKQLIKSVIVKADNTFVMCILSSTHRIDLNRLARVLRCKEALLATETEIEKLFPDYEVGAEPPFGQLYGLKVYVDEAVPENEEIAFNAGSHTDLVKVKYRDFAALIGPVVADFGVHI